MIYIASGYNIQQTLFEKKREKDDFKDWYNCAVGCGMYAYNFCECFSCQCRERDLKKYRKCLRMERGVAVTNF